MRMFKEENRFEVSKWRILLAGLGVLLLLGARVFFSPDGAEYIVRYYGYWFTFVTAVGLLFLSFSERSVLRWDRLFGTARGFWIACGVVTLGTWFTFLHSDFGYKVAMDEYVLSATSRFMHMNREIQTPASGVWHYNYFTFVEFYSDKRPWLYPFAVSLIHDLTGYRTGNAFVVNAVSAVLLLLCTYRLGYLIAGAWAGVLGVSLWVSLPLFSQNATSSGMEMLNLLMIVRVALLAHWHMRVLSLRSESMLSLSAVLLAYSRYESVIFVLPVALIIVLGWIRQRSVKVSVGTICAAPLLIGLALQNKFFSSTEHLWELPEGVTEPFGVANFVENLPRALYFFFNWDAGIANSLLLSILGVPALVLLLLYVLRQGAELWRRRPEDWALIIFCGFLLVHFGVIMCYHAGQLDRLFASRFALPFCFLLIFAIINVLGRHLQNRVLLPAASGVAFLFILGVTMPMNAKAIFTLRNHVGREIEWMTNFAEEHFAPRSLVVDQYKIAWLLEDWRCATYEQAFGNAERIKRELMIGKYPEMYIVDRREITLKGTAPVLSPSVLPSGVFGLELIAEKSFKPYLSTRIYRVEKELLEDAKTPSR